MIGLVKYKRRDKSLRNKVLGYLLRADIFHTMDYIEYGNEERIKSVFYSVKGPYFLVKYFEKFALNKNGKGKTEVIEIDLKTGQMQVK